MTTRVVERAVTNTGGGEVGVRASGGRVRVSWPCGDARSFTPEGLTDVMAHLAVMADFPDVWFHGTDAEGRHFFARMEDGELTVNTSPVDGTTPVSWRPLRKVLRKAVPQPEDDE